MQVSTTLSHATRALERMGSTLTDLVAATKALAEQEDECSARMGQLEQSVRSASENVATLNARLSLDALARAERPAPAAPPPSPSTPSSPADPGASAAEPRPGWLRRMGLWYQGLRFTLKIAGTVALLIPALGAVIYAAWRLLAWLRPGHVPPPPPAPLVAGPR